MVNHSNGSRSGGADRDSSDDRTNATRVGRRPFLRAGAATGLAIAGMAGTGTATEGVASATDPGDVVWMYDGSGNVRSPPTVVDDRVVVGGYGGVAAIDAHAGKGLWEEGRQAYDQSPCVVGDTVYAAFNGERVIAAELEPEAQDGTAEVRWEFEMDARNNECSPTAADGTVYVADGDGVVYALDGETGDEEWRFDLYDRPIRSSPTVVDGTVYIGAGDYQQMGGPTGALFAIHAESGNLEWIVGEGQPLEWEVRSPTVVDGVVYTTWRRGGAGGDAALFAHDADTGEELYSVIDEGAMNTWNPSPPTVADGVIYISSVNYVAAIDAADGSLIWSTDIDSSVPTVADGTVFTTDDDAGKLVALNASNGEELWRTELGDGDQLLGGTIVVNGTVFVAGEEGVFAVDGGVDGHSEDSKVLLGTLGNHHEYAGTDAPTGDYDGEPTGDAGGPSFVEGTVTDLDTGEPIERLWIQIQDEDENGDSEFTDEDGRYSIQVPPGTVRFSLNHDDYYDDEFYRIEDVEVPEGQTVTADIEIGDDGSYRVTGDVERESGLDGGDDDGGDRDTTSGADADDGGDGGGSDDGDDSGSDDGSPGPGLFGTLASIGGAGYLLRRRFAGDPDDR